MAVIGIDLGTTNSLCAVWKDGKSKLVPNTLGEYMTPSVVSINDSGKLIAGKAAKERLITHPACTAASFKLFMGTKKEFKLGGKVFYAEDLSAVVLRQLKQDAELYLNEKVTEAVISVPAYFNDNQRAATKLAGELAGMQVDRIINEPSASALAYHGGNLEDNTFIVFDLGGGTLDISLVDAYENIVEIIAISGDNHFGGDNFDAEIARAFLKQNPGLKGELTAQEQAALKRQAELCKMALSGADNVAMVFEQKKQTYSMVFSRKELVEITSVYFARIKALLEKVLKDGRTTASGIDEVLLVGGSTRMTVIKDYLASLLGKRPNDSIHPDHAVALGAGYVVGIRRRSGDIKDMVLTDICPFSLGTDVYNFAKRQAEFFPMIERNSTLPCSIRHIFSTVKDNQKKVKISVYQGESLQLDHNLLLETIDMKIPEKPAGQVGIAVTFSYDLNGILLVDADCIDSGETVSRVVVNGRQLSEKEKQRRVEQLRQLEKKPEEVPENKALIQRALMLFEESTEELRSMVAAELSRFNEVLLSGRKIEAEKARKHFSVFLDMAGGRDVWQ